MRRPSHKLWPPKFRPYFANIGPGRGAVPGDAVPDQGCMHSHRHPHTLSRCQSPVIQLPAKHGAREWNMASPCFAPLSLHSHSERCLQLRNSNNDGMRQQQRAVWLLIGSLPAQQLSQLLLSTFETVSVFRKTEYWCGADTDVHCCRAVRAGGGGREAQFLGLTFTSAAAGSQGGSTGDHGMYHHGD